MHRAHRVATGVGRSKSPVRSIDAAGSGRRLGRLATAAVLALLPMLSARADHLTPGGPWVQQGPAPTINGSSKVSPNDEVIGAVHALLVHPSDPDIIWIGSVNGGIWRTTNGTDASPTWEPLTEPLPGYSIGDLELDPADPDRLVAGVARVSAFKGAVGPFVGLMRSNNGGDTWFPIADAALLGQSLRSVAIRGDVLLAASTNWNNNTDIGGLFRRSSPAASWVQISDLPGSGLPEGGIQHLVGDPTDPEVFYATVDDDPTEGNGGVYMSDDTGETWTKISGSDAGLNAAFASFGNVCNAELALSSGGGRLFVVVLADVRSSDPPSQSCPTGCMPRYIAYTNDGGDSWTAMDIPRQSDSGGITNTTNASPIVVTSAGHGLKTGQQVTIDGVTGNEAANGTFCITVLNDDEFQLAGSTGSGADDNADGGTWTRDVSSNSGGQGGVHFSMTVDPGNANLLYIGGDTGTDRYRGDISVAPDPDTVPSPQWTVFENSGTASDTAPHADSRHMTFDADGRLINVDDGGIFTRTSPQDNTGDWFSIIGNLNITEIHDIAYDANSEILFGGMQDNGTQMQVATGDIVWTSMQGADGGDVAVDDTTVAGESTRFFSIQNLGGFKRWEFDANNANIGMTDIAADVQAGSDPLVPQFVTPFVLNAVDPIAMVVGACNAVYESFDQGDTFDAVGGFKTCDFDADCRADDGVCSNDSNQKCDEDDDCDAGATCDLVTCDENSDCDGVSCVLGANADINGSALVYGHPDNPDLIAVGSGAGVFIRTTMGGDLQPTAALGADSRVTDIALDPDHEDALYVAALTQVFGSVDGGDTWAELTGNIGGACAPADPACPQAGFQAIEYIEGAISDKLVLGTEAGVFAAVEPHFDCWFELGDDLPSTLIWDFDYHAPDDLLIAGTLGRGAWTLEGVADIEVPVLTLPTTDLDFGTVCVGATGKLTLEVCNTGHADLQVGPIVSSDPQFTVKQPSSGWPVVISPDFCFPVQVTFTPGAVGPQTGELTIPSSDPCRLGETVQVSGIGGTGDITVTGSTSFGDVCAGTLAEKIISVCNTGMCDLSVVGAFVFEVGHPGTPCDDFEIINNPFPNIISKDFCIPLTVRFTPTSGGPKSCDLLIESQDPDEGEVIKTLTANTPYGSIEVAGDQSFPPEVIQSVDACSVGLPFPIVNTGICPATVEDVTISINDVEYSLSGLPPLPLTLLPGEEVGEGRLEVLFAPQALDRDLLGQAKVTWIIDPIIMTDHVDTSDLCGEGTRTGARVRVTAGGVPLPEVKSIKVQRLGGNRNGTNLDTIDSSHDVPLQTLNPDSPCGPIQFHTEYGTIGNPIQLLPGSYQVTVQARVNGRNARKTVGFDVGSCDFNPTIVVDF